MGDGRLVLAMLIEQVWVAADHYLRCYSSKCGWRSAITCDGNRTIVGGGRPVLVMLIEQVWVVSLGRVCRAEKLQKNSANTLVRTPR